MNTLVCVMCKAEVDETFASSYIHAYYGVFDVCVDCIGSLGEDFVLLYLATHPEGACYH